MDAFKQLGARVLAATSEGLDKAQEMAAKVSLPIAYGVSHGEVEQFGGWWEDRRQIIQPANFVLNDAGKVMSATYSSGPVGRLEADDAIRFLQFMEKQKAG